MKAQSCTGFVVVKLYNMANDSQKKKKKKDDKVGSCTENRFDWIYKFDIILYLGRTINHRLTAMLR